MIESIQAFDKMLFTFINVHGRVLPMDIIFPVISDFGYFKVPVIIICLLVLFKGTSDLKKNIITVVLAILIADFVSSSLLKPLFARVRPCHIIQGLHLIGRCSDSFSFPSSHAVNITAFACTMSHFYPKWKRLFWIIAFSVCYSRVYLGMHYPIDCMMGALLGFVVAHLSIKHISPIVESIYHRKNKYAR